MLAGSGTLDSMGSKLGTVRRVSARHWVYVSNSKGSGLRFLRAD